MQASFLYMLVQYASQPIALHYQGIPETFETWRQAVQWLYKQKFVTQPLWGNSQRFNKSAYPYCRNKAS